MVLSKELADVFERQVLPRLEPTDRAMLGQVGSAWRALVASCIVGPGACCSLRHPTHLQPASLELPGGLSNALRTLDYCVTSHPTTW